MTTLGLRMPDVLKDRLDSAATLTRRTKSQIALMAIEYYLEELEFWTEAKQRYNSDEETVSHDDVKKELGLD